MLVEELYSSSTGWFIFYAVPVAVSRFAPPLALVLLRKEDSLRLDVETKFNQQPVVAFHTPSSSRRSVAVDPISVRDLMLKAPHFLRRFVS